MFEIFAIILIVVIAYVYSKRNKSTVKVGIGKPIKYVEQLFIYQNPGLLRGNMLAIKRNSMVEFRTKSTNSDNYTYRSLSGAVDTPLTILLDETPIAVIQIPSTGIIDDLMEHMEDMQLTGDGTYSLYWN